MVGRPRIELGTNGLKVRLHTVPLKHISASLIPYKTKNSVFKLPLKHREEL